MLPPWKRHRRLQSASWPPGSRLPVCWPLFSRSPRGQASFATRRSPAAPRRCGSSRFSCSRSSGRSCTSASARAGSSKNSNRNEALCLRAALDAAIQRPRKPSYPPDTRASCVLASHRPSHPGGEASFRNEFLARALVPVRARLADEPLEQQEVVALLRVPQHAEGEARTGILERLGRAVLHRPRDLFQAATYTTVGLVVMRLHRSAVAEDRRETAPAAQVDVVVGERAGCVLVPLGPHDLG